MVQIGKGSSASLKGSNLLMAFVLLLSGLVHAAGISVVSTVETNEISLGEVLVLTVTVSSDSQVNVAELKLPHFEGFDTGRGGGIEPSRQFSQARHTVINGQMETVISQSFVYELLSQKAGRFTIPSAEAVVDGQTYKSQPIEVTVLASGQKPHRPQQKLPRGQIFEDEEDPFSEAEDMFQHLLRRRGLPGGLPGGQNFGSRTINPDEAFFIQLEADKNEAFVGEQVTASWYLYTRNSIQNIDTLKYPILKAFYKEDIEVVTRLDWKQEIVNGIPYRKALLVSYALFPIKEGTALIDSYKAQCTLATGGVFGGGQTYKFTKASQEIKVRVNPLPNVGRPEEFSGGVGRFAIRSFVDSITAKVNEPFTLKVRIEGSGNAKSVDLPSLDLPSNVEVYSQRDESKFNRDGSSHKEFEILLIPRQVGRLVLPALTMGFFDPQSSSYYTAQTTPIEINVSQSTNDARASVNPSTESKVTDSEKFYQPELILDATGPSGQKAMMIIAGLLLLTAGVVGFTLWRFRVEFQWGSQLKNISLKLKKRFGEISQLMNKNEWRKVGGELMNAIYYAVGAVTGESHGVSIEMNKLLESLPPSLKRDYEEKLRRLLVECEKLSFAPEEIVGPAKDYANLRELKSEVESVLRDFISHSELAS